VPMRFALDGTTVTRGLYEGVLKMRIGQRAIITYEEFANYFHYPTDAHASTFDDLYQPTLYFLKIKNHRCSPTMAYGEAGMPPLVKPNAFVIYHVEV